MTEATGSDRNVEAPRLDAARLRRVEAYVAEHLADDLSVEKLAKAAHMSASCFSRLFREATGTTPHRYVVRQRVEAARRLIEQSSQFSLAEIAARTGFADQAHLTRRFREVLGVTPAAFCRQNGRRR